MSTPSEREAREARVDKAVAQDVAAGMAAKADHEAARADAAQDVALGLAVEADREAARASRLAAANAQQGVNLRQAQAQRDAAAVSAAGARAQARNAAFGFWLLLGAVAVVLLVGAIWYATRPEPASETVVIHRDRAPAAPPAAARPRLPRRAPPRRPRRRPSCSSGGSRSAPVPVPVAPPRQPSQTIIVQPSSPASAAPESDPARPEPDAPAGGGAAPSGASPAPSESTAAPAGAETSTGRPPPAAVPCLHPVTIRRGVRQERLRRSGGGEASPRRLRSPRFSPPRLWLDAARAFSWSLIALLWRSPQEAYRNAQQVAPARGTSPGPGRYSAGTGRIRSDLGWARKQAPGGAAGW